MGHRIACLLLCLSLSAACQASKQEPGPASSGPPTAVFHTSAGDMRCVLFPAQAPKAVENFIGLATGRKDWTDPITAKRVRGTPLYDGVTFHRVIPNFMIQGGDPSGTGSGDVGITFNDELHSDLLFDQPGRLAMANSGPNTNGSQFFITEVAVPRLNPCFDQGGCQRGARTVPMGSGYTIFGQCDDATVELVKKIARMPCHGGETCSGGNFRPLEPVTITHIEILNDPGAPPPPPRRSKPRK